MIIPATIKVFNQTIKIVFKRDLIDKEGAFGMWDLNKNKIYLQQSTRKNPLTIEQIQLTLCHEILHSWLDITGYHSLGKQEKFVSTISSLIHQFIIEVDA